MYNKIAENLNLKSHKTHLWYLVFIIFYTTPIFTVIPCPTNSCYGADVETPDSAAVTPYTIIICENTPAIRGNPATKNISIPDNLTVEYGYIEIIAYCDPDDIYIRGIKIYMDGIGGPIGMECVGINQYLGDTISPGETVHRYYDLKSVKFGGPNPDERYFYHNFIPNGTGYEDAKLSPGNHTVVAWITNDPDLVGDEVDSKLTVYFKINQELPSSGGSGSDSNSGSSDSDSGYVPEISESLSFIIIIGGITFVILPAAIIIGLVIAARHTPKLGDVGESENVSGEKQPSGPSHKGLRRCPQCGVYNTSSARICNFCGFMLKPVRRRSKR